MGWVGWGMSRRPWFDLRAAALQKEANMTVNDFLGGVKGVAEAAGSTINAIKGSGSTSGTRQATASSAWPSWATPVAIGAGVLLVIGLVVSLFRRK